MDCSDRERVGLCRAEEAGAFGAIVADNDEKNDELTISMTDDQTDRKINIPVAFLLGMDG